MPEIKSEPFVVRLVGMGERPTVDHPDSEPWYGPPGNEGVNLAIGEVRLFAPTDREAMRALASHFGGPLQARLVIDTEVKVEAPPEPKAKESQRRLLIVSRNDVRDEGADTTVQTISFVVGCDICRTKAYFTVLGFQFGARPHLVKSLLQMPPGWVAKGGNTDLCPACAEKPEGPDASADAGGQGWLGARLASLRSSAGITQDQLEERSGINRMTISKIEGGQLTDPAISILVALAQGLGLNVANLIRGADHG